MAWGFLAGILPGQLQQSLGCSFSPSFSSSLHMAELRLEGNFLHRLPNEVSTLQHLKAIDLSRNQFRDFPEQLTTLPALETINLEENEIVGEWTQPLWPLYLPLSAPPSSELTFLSEAHQASRGTRHGTLGSHFHRHEGQAGLSGLRQLSTEHGICEGNPYEALPPARGWVGHLLSLGR